MLPCPLLPDHSVTLYIILLEDVPLVSFHSMKRRAVWLRQNTGFPPSVAMMQN